MKPLTATHLIKILEASGFALSRQRGSHAIYHQASTGISVPVPIHGRSRPIHIGTFLAIVKQSKIPKDKFK